MTELFNKFAYQIKRVSDGLFSIGGHRPVFNKKGKIWKSRHALNLHLNYYSRRSVEYSDCIIIENELVNGNIISKEYDINEWMKNLDIESANKEQSKRVVIKKKILGYEIYNVDLNQYNRLSRIYVMNNKGICKSFPVCFNQYDIKDELT